MSVLTQAILEEILPALDDAAQADETKQDSISRRYVEIETGIRARLGVERHQLLTGRRGVGKSALLFATRQYLSDLGDVVVYVDMQHFSERPVIETELEIVLRVVAALKPSRLDLRRAFLRRRLNKVQGVLRGLQSDPEMLTRTITRARERVSNNGGNVAIQAEYKAQKMALRAKRESGRSDKSVESGEAVQSRRARLGVLSAEIADCIRVAVKSRKVKKGSKRSSRVILILDDFYFMPYLEQPDVLGVLDGIFSGTGVWMKVGGVAARLNPYREGTPPVGLENSQDAAELSLDVTLAEFKQAQSFLEEVLAGVLAQWSLTASTFLTEAARTRLVLACGGAVFRDYVTYVSLAISAAQKRLGTGISSETPIKVQVTDVQKAVSNNADRKVRDAIARDGGADSEVLSQRWDDVTDFVRARDTLFILVSLSDVDRTPWGRNVSQLENLRLLHRIAIVSAKSGAQGRMVLYMVDLGHVFKVRANKEVPEFWKGSRVLDTLRRAQWEYSDSWR